MFKMKDMQQDNKAACVIFSSTCPRDTSFRLKIPISLYISSFDWTRGGGLWYGGSLVHMVVYVVADLVNIMNKSSWWVRWKLG